MSLVTGCHLIGLAAAGLRGGNSADSGPLVFTRCLPVRNARITVHFICVCSSLSTSKRLLLLELSSSSSSTSGTAACLPRERLCTAPRAAPVKCSRIRHETELPLLDRVVLNLLLRSSIAVFALPIHGPDAIFCRVKRSWPACTQF